MTKEQIITASKRLLHPYHIPRTCPYLSDDQRELSTLNMNERSAWMAEWLMLATPNSFIPRSHGRPPPAPRI